MNIDINGNLNLDNNKAISTITYNHLNLPQSITVTGKGTITYTYNATGNKLKKVTIESPTRQPRVVLGYDLNTSKILPEDISSAQNNTGTFIPLSNPGAFNKTISFYHSAGDLIPPMNYTDFKNSIRKIKAHVPR